jgi:RNA polymerase sigma-70 factor (ECF subfamily)
MPTRTPDRALLEKARRGDERAFEVVVDAYGGLVLGIAWRVVRDRQEAEDVAQEVFLRLYRVFDRYDPSRPFLPWLKRVAMNLTLNLVSGKARKARKRTASLEILKEDRGELPVDEGSPEAGDRALERERAASLRAAIGELRPEYEEILRLRYFENLAYEELVEELSLPMGTVKNRLFRAREALAERLREVIG